MKTFSSELQTELLKTQVNPLRKKIIIYKRWPGMILNYSSADAITVAGDATDFFSLGDTVIVSHVEGIEEYTLITNIIFSTDETTIQKTGGSTWANQLSNNKGYVYKKFEIDEDLLAEGLGDIEYTLEGSTINSLVASDVRIKIENHSNDYWDEVNKTGMFFRDSISGSVDVVSATQITATELSVFPDDSLKGYYIEMINGDAISQRFQITANTGTVATVLGSPSTNGVIANDDFRVKVENNYIIAIQYGIVGMLGSNERINIYGGVIYGKDVEYNQESNIIELRAMGFLKDFEKEKAYETASLTDYLSYVYGQALEYQQGNADYIRYGIRSLKYTYPGEESIPGISIKSIHRCTAGLRILRFKKPNWFSYDGGDWTQITSDGEEYLYSSKTGDRILFDFNIDDFSFYNAIEFLGINYDFDSYSKLDINNIGTATVQFDEGRIVDIMPEMFRIWECASHPTGSDDEFGSDFTEVGFDDPIELLNGVDSEAFYFASHQRFNSFELIGLISSGSISGTWYYSHSIGDADAGWSILTVTNGTSNFTEDGILKFTMPDDWQSRNRIGEKYDNGLYYIKFVESTGTPSLTVDRVLVHTYVEGQYRDYINLRFLPERMTKEEVEENIVIRHDDSDEPEVASWGVSKRPIDLLQDLIEKTGYSLGATYDDSKLNLANTKVINFWGKPARENEVEKAECICHTGTYMYVALRNEVYRIKEDTSYELIFTSPYRYYIKQIFYDYVNDEVTGLGFVYRAVPKSYDAEGNKEKYWESPKSIMFSIDSPDSTTPTTAWKEWDTVEDDSPIDNQIIIKSGYLFQEHANDNRTYKILGFIDTNMFNPSPVWAFRSENLFIPFPQVVEITGTHEYASAHYQTPEVDSGVFDWIDIKTFHPRLGWSSTLDRETDIPIILPTGYYIFLTYCSSAYGWNTEDKEAGIAFTMNQPGGYCLWNTAGIVRKSGGTINKGIFTQVDTTAGDRHREYSIINEDGEVSYPLAYGGGEEHDSSNYIKWINREHCLSACLGETDIHEILITTYRCEQKAQQESLISNPEYWTYPARIEGLIAKDDIDDGYEPHRVYHYNGSTYTRLDSGSPPWSRSVAIGDYIYIYDYRKFAGIQIYGSGILPGDFTCETAYGGGPSYNSFIPEYDNVRSPSTLLIDYRLWENEWETVDPAFLGDASGDDVQMIRLTCTRATTVSNVSLKRKILWENKHSDYSTNDYSYMPVEIAYNSSEDMAYGSLFDRATLQYYIYQLDLAAARTKSNDNTNLLITQSGIDEEMTPKGFAYNSDGKVYFTMTDPRYRTKTTKLFSVEDDSGIDVNEVVDLMLEGEWNIRGNLVCNSGDVIGLTGDKKTNIFVYSNEHYIRIPIADWADKNCKEAILELTELMGTTLMITSDRKVRVVNRLEDGVSSDKELNEDYVKEIKDVGIDSKFYDGIVVSYSTNKNFISSTMGPNYSLGLFLPDSRILNISNSLISNYHMAKLIGEHLYPIFNKIKKSAEVSIIMYPAFEALDFFNSNLSSSFLKSLSAVDIFRINSVIISDKRCEVLLKGTKEN